MSPLVPASTVVELVDHLHARQAEAALALAVALADDGVPTDQILIELLCAAMVDVGERWYRDEFSVADEHAATAVADTVLTLLSAHEARTIATGPHVVALCPEGEWHTMPLRISARLLELGGLEVTVLGASLPSDHLARFLARTRPDAVALSCSTPLAFPGALAAVQVAHAAGLPVMAGGRAFDDGDGRRARALGVDAWAPSAETAVALVRGAAQATLREPTADGVAAGGRALDRPRVIAVAVDELVRRYPPMADYTQSQLRRTHEDLDFILQYVEAAILVDDASVFHEFLGWLQPLLLTRDVPREALGAGLAVLRDVTTGATAELLDRGARTLPR